MPLLLVLDTSAVLGAFDVPPGTRAVAPDSIETEIRPGGAGRRRFDYQREAGLVLMRPGAEARARAIEAARGTGDTMKLSGVDLDVLALALETGGEIVTDDYAIQNVAAALGVAARSVHAPGIRERWRWSARCTGCGRSFDEPPRDGTCPVCGHAVRARRAS